MTLREATRDLHHYIETETAVGRAMAAGTPTRTQYVGWLSMKLAFARMVAPHIPPASRRDDLLATTLIEMGEAEVPLAAARAHAEWLTQGDDAERERRMTGTAYVVCGAVFGGEVIARKLAGTGFPTNGLVMRDRDTELPFLRQLRYRSDCAAQATETFRAMVLCCNEIEG